MLTKEQKDQFSQLFEELGNSLDITENQHEEAVRSYNFVAKHLAAPDSPLSKFNPEILPQGSFLLGTMIKPIHEHDDLDIDLVCRLEGKAPEWTQYDVKQIVGERLKNHGTIEKLVVNPDGRRCWRLDYHESAKFHMDILPSIVSKGYKLIMERAFANTNLSTVDSLAISITDKHLPNYRSSISPETWLKCNPFGYAIWFEQRAQISGERTRLLAEGVQPVPKYQKHKLPLKRVVQILKRHRDIMFEGDEHKPISIIISTLAAKAYNKETNLLEALTNVVQKMPEFIEERVDPSSWERHKWVSNPVNERENFADKWKETPQKQENFYKWLEQIRIDVNYALQQKEKGLKSIMESMKKPFGEREVVKAFTNYGDRQLLLRESGGMKMAGVTGTVGTIGRTTIPHHNNYGAEE